LELIHILIYTKKWRTGMADTAKVFTSGRSQAVRLPKEFRFKGNEVYIKKEKGRVVLSEKPLETWAEIFGNFRGDPGFSVHRELLKDKPREVSI
jgi:antitoxin VapB